MRYIRARYLGETHLDLRQNSKESQRLSTVYRLYHEVASKAAAMAVCLVSGREGEASNQ